MPLLAQARQLSLRRDISCSRCHIRGIANDLPYVVHMAGRGTGASQNVLNDLLAQMVAALQHVNENLQALNQNPAPSPSSQPLVPPGLAEYRGLDEFYRRNPSQFQGGFAPDATIEWVQGLERIFRAMSCSVRTEILTLKMFHLFKSSLTYIPHLT
ncbi:hypothetical protein Lal_00017349 [Lupinus albus]|nr:hypothetical protein Lal_00017349 [Lupinus albus]